MQTVSRLIGQANDLQNPHRLLPSSGSTRLWPGHESDRPPYHSIQDQIEEVLSLFSELDRAKAPVRSCGGN